MNSIAPAYIRLATAATEADLARVERALALVDDHDLWWRANEASNSLGNLLLHMAGSHRFWVVSVVGGRPSDRQRQEEFDARGGQTKADLVASLRLTIADANLVLAGLDANALLDTREAFGKPWTVLGAIHHTVTHFSLHTGQVLLLVKMLKGTDLGLPM
jgi:uncharacterized damage-inducible protein DinB